jgi:CRP/FNR family transcriptional regulator, anaerobic regulatory protein
MLKDINAAPAQEDLLPTAGYAATELSLWQALLELSHARSDHDAPLLTSTEHTVPANTNICHPTTWYDAVPVVSSGWAMASVMPQNGRQQILSFLLPGDIVSTALVFGPTACRLVQSITKVSYRTFSRSELKTALARHPELLEKFSKVWIEEKAESDQLAVDLGRRTADERIARLILRLSSRLTKRGMLQGQAMDFPLRQHQIADATGLTPVHVSRVLGNYRRRGLIEINGRSLTILDANGLLRIANLQAPQNP